MPWNVTGHEWAERLLVGHIRQGEVRHAYLFSGPPGVGRRTLVLRLTQALFCLQPSAPGQPCETCRACRQVEQMQHPDLSIVQAESEGGTLRVDQVRELQKTLSLLPYEAPYRVAWLLRFQQAHASAQNALLKTLEEAPPRVILLLTADSPDLLLPTIVSRCEVLRLRPLAVPRLEEELTTRGLPRAEAHLLAHLSEGRLGYALRLREDRAFLEQRSALLDDWLQLLSAGRTERFTYIEGLTRGAPERTRETLRGVLQVWLTAWRDTLRVASGASLPLVNPDRAEVIRQVAQQAGFSVARQCVHNLMDALARLDANVNARLLAEVTLLDWPRISLHA